MQSQKQAAKADKPTTGRIFIYPKDIAQLTGKSYNAGLSKYTEIKLSLGKQMHQGLTVEEYANYEGVEVAVVQKAIW
jgi:hypothetical protein